MATADHEEMSDRLAAIRRKLAHMRDESRASLARLAATREQADGRAALRTREDVPAPDESAAP